MDQSILSEFFAYVDTDKDGYITIQEIKNACAVDINQDGIVTEDEKIQCARIWLTQYMASQDLDNDQRISLSELLQFNGIVM